MNKSSQALFIPQGHKFIKNLGTGTLGSSILLCDEVSNVPIVCKIINKAKIGNNEAVQRFVERVDHVKLIRSPFVIPFDDVIDYPDFIVLTRKYIEMPSIADNYGSSNNSCNVCVNSADQNAIFAMWKIIVRTFAHLHQHHIYPSFIKPSNLFVVDNKYIVVTDIYQPPADIDLMVHSPTPFDLAFLAPEYFNPNREVKQAADVWSLGLLLGFMITRSLPWDMKNVFSMMTQIQSGNIIFSSANDIPDEITSLLSRLLIVDPDQRPALEELTKSGFEANAPDVSTDNTKRRSICLDEVSSMSSTQPISHGMASTRLGGKNAVLGTMNHKMRSINTQMTITGYVIVKRKAPTKGLTSFSSEYKIPTLDAIPEMVVRKRKNGLPIV